MIKSVAVENYLGKSMVIELMSPEKSGFIITNIEGLGPANAKINTSSVATADGSTFNSAMVKERNITIELKYYFVEYGMSVEEARRELYKYFPIKKPLKLTIETDKRTAFIDGYVETHEEIMFGSTGDSAKAKISIICPNPFFYSKDSTTSFSGITPLFEFPFESVYGDFIEFGDITFKKEKSVFYEGEAETGVKIYIHCTGKVTGLGVYNLNTREKIIFNDDKIKNVVGSIFDNGDTIVIDTNRGEKSIMLFRNGIFTNILNCITRDSSLFYIAKGDNMFVYVADDDLAANLQFRIVNNTLYEGI